MDESNYQSSGAPHYQSSGAPHYQSSGAPQELADGQNPFYQSGGAPQEEPADGPSNYYQSSGAPQEEPADGPSRFYDHDDPSNPISYIRDPHKLIVYLIPFPKPSLSKVDSATVPKRFLIYTPPPPPLAKPAEGVKEGKVHKVQRKWQEEIRDAKTSTAKTASWKGIKSKVLKGISWAADKTTSSNLDFLSRVADNTKKTQAEDKHAEDGVDEGVTTKKTVGVEELVLVYPSTMKLGPDQLREEFVNTMLRTRTKAQRDAIISTALLPVSFGIDILATPIWPFGGLGEVDAVWAYSNIRGAKTARSVTKRLSSSADPESQEDENKLHLNFVQSDRVDVMSAYLLAECERDNQKLFPSSSGEEGPTEGPTEEQVLSAIGWSPSEREKNWEDEQWEMTEVKLDLRNVMRKGAKEWIRWCKAYEKNPQKAIKK